MTWCSFHYLAPAHRRAFEEQQCILHSKHESPRGVKYDQQPALLDLSMLTYIKKGETERKPGQCLKDDFETGGCMQHQQVL